MTTNTITFDRELHDHDNPHALHQVLYLVRSHQLPFRTLTAKEIVQDSRLLPNWISDNATAIAESRVADDTLDWYFPIVKRNLAPSLTWSGIHHLTEDQASEVLQTLPSLPSLPPAWHNSTIVASAGGLLLLRMSPTHSIPGNRILHVRRCKRCGTAGRRHVDGCSSFAATSRTPRSQWRRKCSSPSQHTWRPLLVCNPLKNSWRALPDGPWCPSTKWRYDEVQTNLIVDERENSYQVVLTFTSQYATCFYSSPTNAWTCRSYTPCPRNGPALTWQRVCASTLVHGRLHYAFLQITLPARTRAVIQVFDINVETGVWSHHSRHALRKRVWNNLATPFVRRLPQFPAGEQEILPYLQLVECMGDLYAILPSRMDEIVIRNNGLYFRAWHDVLCSYREDCDTMPLQFQVLRLDDGGNGDGNGVLRIQVPRDATDIAMRRMSLEEKLAKESWLLRSWFSCCAKGSVIWVACEDYLLKYDVLSGQSKTQIIEKRSLVDAGVSYRPSFHMEP